MEQLTEEEIQTALLVATMFNSITEKYPDVLTNKKLYTEEELKEFGLKVLNLGMSIRQDQLMGFGGDKSGKEQYFEWFEKNK